MRNFIFCTILFLFFSLPIFGQKYQRSFYVEDRFKNEVVITKNALKAMGKDEQIQDCLKYSKENSLSSEWFNATEINLNTDKYPDLIIEPISRCRTAMRPPYWVLLNKGNNYELVLTANTFSLYINKEKTNNHFNITIDWSTANTHYTTTYGFNGKKYFELAEITKPNI